MEDVMIRISVLWIFFAVAYSVHYALSFFEPGALQKILSGENTTATKLVHMMLIGETCIGWLIRARLSSEGEHTLPRGWKRTR